jgi:TonB family protein
MTTRGAIFALLAVLLAGCSSVGRGFDNFTAYYNTFYNAKKAFGRAVEASVREDRPVDRSVYLQVFEIVDGSPGAKEFESAVKKSADVLRGHPDSKWVDDALLLIGKSYYYTGNTVGAEQKFREVVDGESKLEDEARFWLVLTLMAEGSLDQAEQFLNESLDREKVDKNWGARMRLALGDVYSRQERWEEAASDLSAGLERVGGETAARAAFLLGQILETIGDFEGSVDAYAEVSKHKPLYELDYAGRYNRVRVQGFHVDSERALKDLRKMERDDKNFAYRGELAFLRGRIFQAVGDYGGALQIYREVLYDSDARISDIRGRVHYALGTLFRDDLKDFQMASAHFDTASASLRGRGASGSVGGADASEPAPDAISDADEQAQTFRRFAEIASDVSRMDSLLYLGSLDQESFDARIAEIAELRAEQLAKQQREQEERAIAQQFGGEAAGFRDSNQFQTGSSTGQSESGFLSFRDPARVQEGLTAFYTRWGERPLVPNWRRLEVLSAQTTRGPDGAVTQAGTEGEQPGGAVASGVVSGTTEGGPRLDLVDVSDVPRDDESRQEMRSRRAISRYELGNVLFLSIGLPDSAATWYRLVLDEDSGEPVAQRALFALGEVQLALGDSSSARRIFRIVVDDYPESEFAPRAAERLGQESDIGIVAGISQGYHDYESAFRRWGLGQYEPAMLEMVRVASAERDSALTPKALLAAGSIYSEWAALEGVSVFEPIEFEVPDSLWIGAGVLAPDEFVEVLQVDSDSATGEPGRLVPVDAGGDESNQAEAAGPDSTAIVGSVSEALGTASPDSSFGENGAPGVPPAGDNEALSVPADSSSSDLPSSGVVDLASDSTEASTAANASHDTIAVGGVGDSVAVSLPGADSTRAAAFDPDTTASPPVVLRRPLVRVEMIYASVAERFQGSEYGRFATEALAAFEEFKQSADSTAEAEAFSGFVDADTTELVSLFPDTRTDSTGLSESPAPSTGEVGDAASEDAPAVLTIDDVSRAPLPAGGLAVLTESAAYPDSARAAGVSGNVLVSYTVDERGRVSDIVVENSVGYGCDEEAISMVRKTRFRPGVKDGKTVAVRMSRSVFCGPEGEGVQGRDLRP